MLILIEYHHPDEPDVVTEMAINTDRFIYMEPDTENIGTTMYITPTEFIHIPIPYEYIKNPLSGAQSQLNVNHTQS